MGVMIIEASDDIQRRAVKALFKRCFEDIDSDAVPETGVDQLYAPIVAQYIDKKSGRLIGAALTCRSRLAVASLIAEQTGVAVSNPYRNVLDRHSELDLMCVDPDYRGRGIGSQLIAYLERRLSSLGVRAWFGCVTEDLDVDRLRVFYARHGFTVLGRGQKLPPLLGVDWSMSTVDEPAFYFYKVPKAAG